MEKRISLTVFMVLFVAVNLWTQTVSIPDEDWHLLIDTSAAWQNDEIFLPDELDLNSIPVNAPTGGWEKVSPKNSIKVTLPSTVEEHFWGAFGTREYKNEEYWFGGEDNQVKNGNYLGVSWWWKEIFIPEEFKNKIILLHIRGARLRAEVYINKKLTGYNILTETSFTSDITSAAIPGSRNLIAVRITNPGGRLDWVDTRTMKWNEKSFHMSHGFGGLDRGISISAHDPVYFTDLWIANTPDAKKVYLHSSLKNTLVAAAHGKIIYKLYTNEDENNPLLVSGEDVKIVPNTVLDITQEINYPEAKLWSPESPSLYQIKAEFISEDNKIHDTRNKVFGFRWFEADGIGENAVLKLNRQRIRLVSAISWGFWGYNGLFPTPELAEKEVLAAKVLGMNCINFHRNTGKTEVLDIQDKLGLLRYMEPGGGQTALGEKYKMYAPSPSEKIDVSRSSEPETFAEKYMEQKILNMIRDHRSHPSLVIYMIQNEINPDLQNPGIFNLIRKMHKEDPSRIIALKSGVPPINQVWMKPYDDKIYFDDGSGYSGWWDEHTVGGPGVWRDILYKNPAEFTHRSENKKEIVTWGEMLGAAVPDNQVEDIRQIKQHGGKSYDLKDREEVLNAYDKFLDKWNFRKAFPHTEDLFTDIGNKCYDFWGRVIETAKLSDENDFLVISGWESTAIENHSGLVDNLRNFKGNPELLKERLQPLHPVIKPRSLVIEKNGKAAIDLYLINETNKPAEGKLKLSLKSPSGKKFELGEFTAPAFVKDKFSYFIEDSILTPPLNEEGTYTISFELDGKESKIAEDNFLVIDPYPEKDGLPEKIGVAVTNKNFIMELKKFLPDSEVEEYNPLNQYDLVISSSRLLYGWRSEVDSTTEILNTDDDILYHTESWGYWNNLEYLFSKLKGNKAKVTLKFAEVTLQYPGDRVMNVAINGDTVLKDFDIVKTAGGKNIAVDTVFMIDIPDGIVRITVPKLTTNYAKFSAIKIETADTIIAINCGGKTPYTGKNGLIWNIYSAPINLNDEILQKVKEGLPLLLLPEGEEAVSAYSVMLSDAGAYRHLGHTGKTRQSWMGSWYFVREHPVLKGLPVNQAMKSYYQTPTQNTDGILLEGKDVEVFIGYGRDHDRNIGAGGFISKLGKGKILFYTLPGMISGLTDQKDSMQPVMYKRLLSNSLNYLNSSR